MTFKMALKFIFHNDIRYRRFIAQNAMLLEFMKG